MALQSDVLDVQTSNDSASKKTDRLLVHGLVYPGKTTWGRDHRRWLSRQAFEHEPTELAFVDLLAAVDGLTARREALDERLSRLAPTSGCGRRSPACAPSAASTRSRR